MKITVLGSNGWFDSPTGSTTCIAIETADYNILLDAGLGLVKCKAILDFSKPTWIFISHMHLDHIYGLHTLNYYRFEKQLIIVAPEGSESDLRTILAPPFSVHPADLPYRAEITTVEKLIQAELPFKVRYLPLMHVGLDSGYRFEIEGKSIAYLTDTGYCANALTLAENADLLITEACHLPGKAAPQWPHLDPLLAAKLAADACAKNLLLIHFNGAEYFSQNQREEAATEARKIFSSLTAAYDGLSLQM